MTGDEIKALRRALDLTARKLGEALGVDQATVLAWEPEELFPTKRYVEAMRTLAKTGGEGMREGGTGERGTGEGGMREGGASEKEATGEEGPRGRAPWSTLADPGVWRLFRKLAAYPELRADVEKLARKYADPAGD